MIVHGSWICARGVISKDAGAVLESFGPLQSDFCRTGATVSGKTKQGKIHCKRSVGEGETKFLLWTQAERKARTFGTQIND